MGADSESLLASLTSRYTTARSVLSRFSSTTSRATFRIKTGTPPETIAALAERWPLDDAEKQLLLDLGSKKTGATFIDEKVQAINRAAFHRSAFSLNAVTQLGFVDLAAQLSLSLPQLKLALVAGNLLLALIAHFAMRQHFRALLAGPNALPPKRIFWGLLRNPEYNRAVKRKSRPYAKSAWKEKSLFRPGYFANALSIFIGSQFIIPPEKLIFPISLILGKLSGLFSTAVMVFDIWRGIRAGDDARAAQEREISVYRDLDI